MKIATWNVNSIKARLDHLHKWIELVNPDVILLQETKTIDEDFPRSDFEMKGWHLAIRGQKSYNGVAILSRLPIKDRVNVLTGDDGEARYIEAKLENNVRVASVYVPMGQSLQSDRFPFKLSFLDSLYTHAQNLLQLEEIFVIGGDYNVAPEEDDVYDLKVMKGQVLFHDQERQKIRQLLHLGLGDAFRLIHKEPHHYSWWDYRAGAWQRDLGLRIDHLLLSPQAIDCLSDSGIDKRPRGWEKASDHTPVWCQLSLDNP
jgi:exodeoxyribonuclease-3